MDLNISTIAIADSLEDANGIAEMYPNHSVYDHVERDSDTHASTSNPKERACGGILQDLCGGPHQQNSISTMGAFNAQSIQTIKAAVTMNFGDANQVAQSSLRTHAHINHTPTEQSSSQSQVTDPLETSLYNFPFEVSVMGTQPYHKRRRTGHQNSSNTAPTGFLTTFIAPMDQTTLASTSTADKEYACPKCNMGDGHPIRPYTRKGDTPADKNVSTGTPNSSQVFKPPKTFRNTACFDKHVMAAHKRDFKSSDSPEYICRYCPCGSVDEHLACAARFAENDFDGLLQHLRESHARPLLLYRNNTHDHWCASLSTSFQLQSLCSLANDPSESVFGL